MAASRYAEDETQRRRIWQKLPLGGGWINETIMHIADRRMPFGGIGNSGTGHYHGDFGFEAFTHLKSVLIKSESPETELRYPPYTEAKLKWIKKLF